MPAFYNRVIDLSQRLALAPWLRVRPGACGLALRAIRGVDPAPFKIWLWPHLPRLAGPVRTAALALATFLSIPMDVLLGRRSVERSWHAVFILEHAREHAPEHAGG